MRKSYFFLLIIFLGGCILRFYHLGDFPVGFHRDEAFLGYNAYSILKTGRDISGNFLPFHLESFLFSPAGYSYFSIPFIFLFDLTSFSVRFASAFFGSLTILISYFLAKELFKINSKQISDKRGLLEIPIIVSAMLAISPWHITLSRTATENVIVVFFITLGVFLYLLWARKNIKFLRVGSFLSFGITMLLYQAPRAFLPLFIPMLIILLSPKKVRRKYVLTSIGYFTIFIILPVFMILSSKELSLRLRTVSIFATGQTQLVLNQQIREDGVAGTSHFISRSFHNKLIGYSMQFLQNYFKHFSFDFLFTDQGFPDRYRVPLVGEVYLFELPFLLLGLLMLIKKREKVGLILAGWVMLTPVGSALAFDDIPNLQRTLIMQPALSIISAYGIVHLKLLVQGKRVLGRAILSIILLGGLYNLFFYLHQYYFHVNVYSPWYRNDGYKELVSKVNILLPSYKKAVITDRESAPTIFFLFYGKYDPSKFHMLTYKSSFRDFDRVGFEKYNFSQEECPIRNTVKDGEAILLGQKNVLYVNSALCKEVKGAVVHAVLKRGDGSEVFRILAIE